MSNTGTFNPNLAVILVLLMLVPTFIFMITQILVLCLQFVVQFISIFAAPDSTENNNLCNESCNINNVSFEDIKLATLKKAANGDKAARDWAMKYVFDIQPTDQKVNVKKYNTDESIINDAIAAMVAVKVKKSDAVSKIKSLVSKKDYKNVSDLFIDAMSFN